MTASLLAIQRDGRITGKVGLLSATVTSARPSSSGNDLLDITFDGGIQEPLPTDTREILQIWYDGGPAEPDLWASYNRLMRHEWSRLALSNHPHGLPDKPSGTTYHLDGRFITDIDAFYCALGEAINGPGGYFGWNIGALHDCLSHGWGAATPFRLIWHHSEVARQHLVPGYDRPPHRLRDWGPSTDLNEILKILTDHNIDVALR